MDGPNQVAGSGLRIVTVTMPDAEAARSMARALVERRLCACVNILPGVISVYRWEGAVEEGAEVLAVIKTTAERLPDLFSAIGSLHPYDLPAIEAVAVVASGDGVADWVRSET